VKKRLSKTTCGLAVFLAIGLFIGSRVARSGPSPEYVSAESSFTGFGSSTDTGVSCADRTCNVGDACDCTTGSVKGATQENGQATLPIENMVYELSVDETNTMDDGTNTGECMLASGNGVMTLKDKSTVDFVMSGMDCTLPGVVPHGLFNGTLRFDGGTAHDGRLRGLGSIKIGDVGGGTTEVFVTAAVDASGGFQ
jgi:hypothetical protein